MDRVAVKLPNGQIRNATYRNEWSDAAYVKVMNNGRETTVSGEVVYKDGLTFAPKGINAHLVGANNVQ